MPKEVALLILRDGDGTREWSLDDEAVIGRQPGSDVWLPDRQVSRRHACVMRTPRGYVVEDLDSKNGTWVNGRAVQGRQLLVDGDEVSIAARFKLYFVDADATAPIEFEGRGLRIDPESRTVYVDGAPLEPPLSGPQYELLWLLYEAEGALVSREDIVRGVWSDEAFAGVTEDAIDALVRRVRLRLEEADPGHGYVVTVRGYGYRLEQP